MTLDFVQLRRQMVDSQIRTVDVTQLNILSALLTVPKESFVPNKLRQFAYLDEDMQIKDEQNGEFARFIMNPAAFAQLLQLAHIKKSDTILDIGAITAYSSAVLAHLGKSVIALENDNDLVRQAQDNLARCAIDNVQVVKGKLNGGYSSYAPFDVIFIEGSVDFVPQNLFDQLREGGRLIAVVGHGNAGVARLFLKENGVISVRYGFNLALKPLSGFQKKQEFIF